MASRLPRAPRADDNKRPALPDRGRDSHDHGPTMTRRTLFKAVGATGLLATGLHEGQAMAAGKDPYAILIDTTRCVGCRNCELVCAEVNGLGEPDHTDAALASQRSTGEDQYTVVNGHETSRGEIFVKRQCMHCVQPACTSACLTRAMHKTDDGPVVWEASQCMGCRFCMVSCPYDVPKFEYHSATPRIRKCQMCSDRVAEGGQPACVENCPAEALSFGRRGDLLRKAWERIHDDPDGYHHAVYGEHEVGGTGVLYLASVPFEEIGLPTHLGDRPVPEQTKNFLYSVPAVLAIVPALLLGVSRATSGNAAPENTNEEEVDHG
jgi:formate dehydrogenase iron-sulfur subunit